MINTIKFLFLTLTIIIIGTTSSYAYTATKEKAEELREIFQNAIDMQANFNPDIILSGKVSVTPVNTYYNVKMPHIRIGSKQGQIIDLGVIAANMAPAKTEKLWKIVTAIPTPIKILNFDGSLIAKIDIGSQKSAALWHQDLNNIVKADIKYKNITITDVQKNEFNAKIDEISALYNLEDNGNDIWSGPADFFIKNISATGKNNFKLNIDEIYFKSFIEDLNPEAVKKFNEQIEAIAESAQYDRPESTSISYNSEAFLNMFMDYILNSANAYKSDMGIKNIEISGVNIKGEEKITLEEIKFATNIDDIKKGIVNWNIIFKYSDLFVTNAPENVKGLYPQNLNIDFTLNNFPLKGIIKSSKKAMVMNGDNIDSQQATTGVITSIPTLFHESRFSFDINNFFISSDNYDAKINGKIKPDIKSKNMASGEITAELSGLDKLQTLLQKKAEIPKNPNAKDFQQANMMLGMLKSLGKRENDPLTGEPYWTYHLQTQPDGSLYLNGGPVGSLFGQ